MKAVKKVYTFKRAAQAENILPFKPLNVQQNNQ